MVDPLERVSAQGLDNYDIYLNPINMGDIFSIQALGDMSTLEEEYNVIKMKWEDRAAFMGNPAIENEILVKLEQEYQKAKCRLEKKAQYEQEMQECSKRITELIRREKTQEDTLISSPFYGDLHNYPKIVRKVVLSLSKRVYKALVRPAITKQTYNWTKRQLFEAESYNKRLETLYECMDNLSETEIQLLQFTQRVKAFNGAYHYRDLIELIDKHRKIATFKNLDIPLQETRKRALEEIRADRGLLIQSIGGTNTPELKSVLKAIVQGKINLDNIGL